MGLYRDGVHGMGSTEWVWVWSQDGALGLGDDGLSVLWTGGWASRLRRWLQYLSTVPILLVDFALWIDWTAKINSQAHLSGPRQRNGSAHKFKPDHESRFIYDPALTKPRLLGLGRMTLV
uniref:Uncharacterized protein n=1 Tax=Cannabis sativa TaxID=3483 RepID=A0A803PY49_CANSA